MLGYVGVDLMSVKMYLIFIIALIVSSGGIYRLSHNMGVSEGYEQGYLEGNSFGMEVGLEQGNEDGFNLGFDKGYNDGYSNGTADGRIEGFQEGYASGNITGFKIGNSTGYEVGFSHGFNDGNLTGFEEGYIQGLIDGAGTGYTLRDPSYGEMFRFLRLDKTDRTEYVEGEYECVNFASDFIKNAFERGYHCYFVYLDFQESSHAIVAFNTTDHGLIYVEPQYDEIMKPKIGHVYFNRRIFYAPDFDDTILKIILIP